MTQTNQSITGTIDPKSLQNILDSLPVGMLIINQNGLFIDCNQAVLQIFEATSKDNIVIKPPSLLSPHKQHNGRNSHDETFILLKKAHEQGSITFYWDHQTLTGRVFQARVTLKEIIYEDQPCLITTITDMTGQVRDEEFQTLIENNPCALMLLNPDKTISDVNSAFINISGYDKADWIGKRLSEFKVIKREGPTIDDALRTKESVLGKIVVDFPHGIKNMEYSYVPVYDSDGILLMIYVIFADHTELVEKITESGSLIEQCPASIIILEPSGKIISTNPAFREMSHQREEDLRLMRLQDFSIIDREGPGLTDILNSKKISKGRLTVDFDYAIKTLEFTYIPVLDLNNKVTSLVAMYIDISDQVAFRDEIETFIKENPQAILTLNTDLSFTDANPAFTQMMGYLLNEIKHMKLTDIKVIKREGKTIKEAKDRKKPVKGRLITDTPVGIRHVDYVYIPILDKKGQIIKFIEIFSDLTPQTQLIEFLQKEVERISDNFNRLSDGNFDINLEITQSNQHSEDAKEMFEEINRSTDTLKNALKSLLLDVENLAKESTNGNLKARADTKRHNGEFRKIIEGFNETLDSVIEPVQESLRVSKSYSSYNFVDRFSSAVSVKGDWITFRDALNNIGIQVSDAVSMITNNLSSLATSAEEANASIEEVLAGAHQIADNTGKVSRNAELGGDGIGQVLKAMDDLSSTVTEVSRKADSVSVASDAANNLAKGGIDLARESERAMEEITKSSQEVETIVTGINSQMDEIGKIVRLISDIATQTNLLSLNAAIEAARAGEAGRGFAVVAAEVKSLAQDSRNSAKNIEDMIANLQNKAKQASVAMGKSTNAVNSGGLALQQTVASFSQIAGTIEQINKNTVEVASASEEQAASVEEVTASIQEVATLVQNTSHEAGNAAAATEEASGSIDEISRIMNGVVGIVENITKEMVKFKVA